MGQLIKKGTKGPNTQYLTRTKAIRKLQISLNDFRRLCILKGIVPREPPNRKKANHGNSAHTSFYHVKDVAFLSHEPILMKLREHKIFMRRLSRALGRGEWSSADSLEENRPKYKLDNVVKERYPTFIDALRDIDDALCSVFLGASLMQHRRIPLDDIKDCARLAAEWQLYVMHTRSLRKVFLSIKGIYYQAEVAGETITWIVPYAFTQKIPVDVDFRVMRTFWEFYRTLLSFAFYKLYADAGLVYPPPLDVKKDDAAGGIGAYKIQQVGTEDIEMSTDETSAAVGISGADLPTAQDVVQTIAALENTIDPTEITSKDTTEPHVKAQALAVEEEFIPQKSTSTDEDPSQTNLTTLHALIQSSPSRTSTLFEGLVIWIQRECPRHILEFVIKSGGGRVGWPETMGSGSSIAREDDEIVTHVIVDRPLVPGMDLKETRRRKFVQPQWVVDCINSGKMLLEEPYGRGKVLPPHLSPFNAEGPDAYDPMEPITGMIDEHEEDEDDEEGEEEEEDIQNAQPKRQRHRKSKVKIQLTSTDDGESEIRRAELDAERQGVDPVEFEQAVERAGRRAKQDRETERKAEQDKLATMDRDEVGATEDNMAKMLMPRKNRKLYRHMKKVQHQRLSQKEALQQKKVALAKKAKKDGRGGDKHRA